MRDALRQSPRRKFTARIDAGHDFTEIAFVTDEPNAYRATEQVVKAMYQLGFERNAYDLSHQSAIEKEAT